MTAAAFLFHVESPFRFRSLRERITIRKNELVNQIASGIAQDHADYRHRIGKLEGLDEALALIDEMEKNERN
jgi:hypothetical protein